MKRVFLSVQSVAHRRPIGVNPFTYRDTRPLRYRASWWTRGTSSELYQSKLVSTPEEAVGLARKWLARENKNGIRWVDSTDHPERFGYSHGTTEPLHEHNPSSSSHAVVLTQKYTTLVSNGALGTSRFVGTFDDKSTAQAYAEVEAERSRKFASWEVWTGTPQSPGKPVGPIVHGKR